MRSPHEMQTPLYAVACEQGSTGSGASFGAVVAKDADGVDCSEGFAGVVDDVDTETGGLESLATLAEGV